MSKNKSIVIKNVVCSNIIRKKLKNCEPNIQEKSLNNERRKRKWKIREEMYQQYF